MLTTIQIAQVRAALESSRPDVAYPGALTLAITTLAAYERVTALLERKEACDENCDHGIHSHWLGTDELRRAVEG